MVTRKKIIFDFINQVISALILILFSIIMSLTLFGITERISNIYTLLCSLVLIWFACIVTEKVFSFFKSKEKKPYLKNNFISIALLMLLCCIFLSSLISVFISIKDFDNLNIDFFSKIFTFWVTLIYVYCIFNAKSFIFEKKIFFILIFLMSGLTIATFVFGKSKSFYGFESWKSLTLNFSNPNACAIFLSILILGLVLYCTGNNNFYFKLLAFLFICILLFFLILTSSRNPFVAFLFGTSFALLMYKFNGGTKTWIILFAILFPLLFASIYFLGLLSLNGFKFVVNLEGNKSLYTRFDMWYKAFYLLSDSPIFGNYWGASNTGSFHFHNGILDLWCSYGLVATILVCFFVFAVLSICFKKTKKCLEKKIMFWYLLVVFMLSICEVSPYYSFLGSFTFMLFPINLILNQNFSFEKKKYEVLIINNVYGYGSTGKIVENLNVFLKQKNVSALIVCGRTILSEECSNVISLYDPVSIIFSKMFHLIFKTDIVGNFLVTEQLKRIIDIAKCKVVNLHCLNDNYCNSQMLLSFLKKSKIKTIITNHSEWNYNILCGAHSYDCLLFQNKCEKCPKIKCLIKRFLLDFAFNYKIKLIRSFSKNCLFITSVSGWLSSRVNSSSMFKNCNSVTIMNGINENYRLFSKVEIFDLLGFDVSKCYAIHVSANVQNKNKNFLDVVKLANANRLTQFVVLTLNGECSMNIPENMHIFKGISNHDLIMSLYHYAQVSIITSKRETFSMPTAESLVSGCAVCGYKCGGAESITTDIKEYCKLVDFNDFDCLNSTFKEMMTFKYHKEKLSRKAISLYSNAEMCEKYLKLYKEVSILNEEINI